jgi:hypothetical protein
MDIYTPDEQLHRRHAQEQQRDRFIIRYLTGKNLADRARFAHEIEAGIIDRLHAGGRFVSRTKYGEHFDLLVEGLRVEVKAAVLSNGRYQAALRRNDADVLIFVCHDGEREHYFVIPFDRVAGLTHIEIRNARPDRYAGWMAAWRDAWHVVDRLIAAGVNHWQPALLEIES